MFELHCSPTVGEPNLTPSGEYKTYEGVMNALLDTRNFFKIFGEGEFLILKNKQKYQRFILDHDGLREVEMSHV